MFQATIQGPYDATAPDEEVFFDTLPLAAGDTIELAVGPGPSWDFQNDCTGVRATITLE